MIGDRRWNHVIPLVKSFPKTLAIWLGYYSRASFEHRSSGPRVVSYALYLQQQQQLCMTNDGQVVDRATAGRTSFGAPSLTRRPASATPSKRDVTIAHKCRESVTARCARRASLRPTTASPICTQAVGVIVVILLCHTRHKKTPLILHGTVVYNTG